MTPESNFTLPQLNLLREAMLRAYTEFDEIRDLVRYRLGDRLTEVPAGIDLQRGVSKVIAWAEGRGRLGELGVAVCEDRKDHPAVRAFGESLPWYSPDRTREKPGRAEDNAWVGFKSRFEELGRIEVERVQPKHGERLFYSDSTGEWSVRGEGTLHPRFLEDFQLTAAEAGDLLEREEGASSEDDPHFYWLKRVHAEAREAGAPYAHPMGYLSDLCGASAWMCARLARARLSKKKRGAAARPGPGTDRVDGSTAVKSPVVAHGGAFLSYAHADDRDGEVTRFVDRLRVEIQQQLGREFEIFRDRADLKWGDNWKRRIDESLDSVTFLLAILSPSFFQSGECVRELERFRDREGKLGRDDLILPVVWIQPDELSDEAHQLGGFLRQRQYKSWDEYRYHDPYPVEARKAIAELAKGVKAAIRKGAVAKPEVPVVRPATIVPGPRVLERPAGEKWVNPKDGLTYVWIPPGKFRMGCSAGDEECYGDESPAHEVEITRGFWIGETPVTQAAWTKVMKTDPSTFKGESLPVESVSWEDANRYCEAVGGWLPTEAEWEYAARAGTTGARYGELREVAWYGDNSGSRPLNSTEAWEKDAAKDGGRYWEILKKNGNATHPVRGLKANAWGLYDTLGNVWEWVADWYGPYSGEGQKDPRGPASGTSRALRGGSWDIFPAGVRVSLRLWYEPTVRNDVIGFRCAGEFP